MSHIKIMMYVVTEQLQEPNTSGNNDSTKRNPQPIVRPTKFKQPPAFKELCSLLAKFSGKVDEGDCEACRRLHGGYT